MVQRLALLAIIGGIGLGLIAPGYATDDSDFEEEIAQYENLIEETDQQTPDVLIKKFTNIRHKNIPIVAYKSGEYAADREEESADRRASALCRFLGLGDNVDYTIRKRMRKGWAWHLKSDGQWVKRQFKGVPAHTKNHTYSGGYDLAGPDSGGSFTTREPASYWAVFASLSCEIPNDEDEGDETNESNSQE